MIKKLAVIFMALVISAASLTACNENKSENTASSVQSSQGSQNASSSNEDRVATADDAAKENSATAFSDGDYKDVESEEPNVSIELSGNTGTISDTTRGTSGSDVTISSKGIYEVSGSSEDVSIIISDNTKSGNIYLVLNDVSMTNSSKPCIIVEDCDKLIVQCKGSNKLVYSSTENAEGLDGAIYSDDDITINGSGNLSIDSKQHGIVSKNDLKITGSTLNVTAASIGLKANDSVRIGGGDITVTSQHDGVQVENKSGDSYFHMEDGSLKIESGYDGIDVGTSGDLFSGYANLIGGTIDITAGGGSDNSKDSETSQKGVKCDGNIYLEGASVTVSAADDAVHSNASVSVTGGSLELSTSDDGITTTDILNITEGTVNITKSYEGLEGAEIVIDGGEVNIVSTDDGINAGGGSDTSSEEQGPWASGSGSGTLTINGGNVYVNASGDGLDSNGSIYVTGGTVIVEGPTDNGNGAIDKGDSGDCVASITGGTVIAIGSSGMAVNFDTGTQCSALVNLSGSEGAAITVDDGSDFSITATKQFECVVYSSPNMTKGNSYTITADSNSATMDFSSDLYYSDVATRGGGMGGDQMGGPGGHGGMR